ncbi:MAG: hypothetical protein R3Y27_05730 [Clostridia bacterium]
MIKGVNHKVVEVSETECEYFEKIMFFIKPEYAALNEGTIRERASLIANKQILAPPTKTKKKRLLEIFKIVGGAIVGAALAIGVVWFF